MKSTIVANRKIEVKLLFHKKKVDVDHFNSSQKKEMFHFRNSNGFDTLRCILTIDHKVRVHATCDKILRLLAES